MTNIKLTTLGGVRENGKNMYIAEINDSIFVLDAGLKYPENEQLGVDVVIPIWTICLKIRPYCWGFLNTRACGCDWRPSLSLGRS